MVNVSYFPYRGPLKALSQVIDVISEIFKQSNLVFVRRMVWRRGSWMIGKLVRRPCQ